MKKPKLYKPHQMAIRLHKLLQPEKKKPDTDTLLPILHNFCRNIEGFNRVASMYFLRYQRPLRDDIKNTLPAQTLLTITEIL